MRPADFDVQKIIDICQGTCSETIQSAIDYLYPGMSEDDLTSDDLWKIDNEIFNCSQCGWWCEMSESNESDSVEPICNDCNEADY